MDIREVRSFLALAGQSHFGRTARLLNLSQPALTKQIRRLEEDLGGPLLVRGRHGAQLTSLGRLFQAKALDVVRDWDDLLAHTRRVARGEAGRLRLGFGMHTFELVPRAIVRFRKSLPDVDVSLRLIWDSLYVVVTGKVNLPEATTFVASVSAARILGRYSS
jgi:DNA-binding transcriptional LysR family regulator